MYQHTLISFLENSEGNNTSPFTVTRDNDYPYKTAIENSFKGRASVMIDNAYVLYSREINPIDERTFKPQLRNLEKGSGIKINSLKLEIETIRSQNPDRLAFYLREFLEDNKDALNNISVVFDDFKLLKHFKKLTKTK